MANTDLEKTVASELTVKDDTVLGNGDAGSREGVENDVAPASNSSADGPIESTPDKDLSPKASTAATESTKSVTVPSTSTIAPQPKKFSSVNVNKKFLEKNSTPASTTSASASSSAKPAGPVSRPTLAPNPHPSRLVTAKLTAAPQPSITTGPGWSRPSSVAPPIPNGIGPQPSKVSGPPSIPHAGKVIQPQPRAAIQPPHSDTLHSTKPAWGKPTSLTREEARSRQDFPTAAEVAQGSRLAAKAFSVEAAAVTAATAASKQARAEEADTFRGVHLDPNAHHWDEMEEDDNFFDSVVEFGDGRRYEVETVPSPAKAPTPPTQHRKSTINPAAKDTQATARRDLPPVDIPVRKEERFADDFDRSWPRTSPSLSSVSAHQGATFPPPSPKSPTTSAHLSGSESSRVLFNERSNRLEPYNNAHRPGPPKRGSEMPAEFRHPPPTSSNVQVLQKPFDRSRPQANGGPGPQHDAPNLRRGYSQAAAGPPTEPRGRNMSSMGPPPLPGLTGRGPPRDGPTPRQAWSAQPNAFSGRVPSRDSRHPPVPPSSSNASIRLPSQSPNLSHASAAGTSSRAEQIILPPNTDIDEFRKDVMQTAAARAKQRRQEEELEREKERERAKLKAAEIEARLLKAAEVKQAETDAVKTVTAVPLTVDTPAPSTDVQDAAAPKTPQALASRRPSFPRKASFSEGQPSLSRRGSSTATSGPSAVAESWRSHASPLTPAPSVPTTRNVQTRPRKASLVASTSFGQTIPMEEETATNLEVVEFSDLATFVGEPEAIPSNAYKAAEPTKHAETKPVVATNDIVVDRPPQSAQELTVPSKPVGPPSPSQLPSKADLGTWRRKEPFTPSESSAAPSASIPSRPRADSRAPASATEHMPTTPHKPRTQYKEAAMSALDDAMSRIKGALDGMQAIESESHHGAPTDDKKPFPPSSVVLNRNNKERWTPSSFRAHHHGDFELPELFHTVPEPPRSPKPAWNTFTVRLPKPLAALKPVEKRQLTLFNRVDVVRWDILSFNPPVEGMTRKELSLNNVLFRIYPNYKGKVKYRVLLPKSNARSPKFPRSDATSTPRSSGGELFGKINNASDASTWRQPSATTAVEPTPTPSEPMPNPMSPLPKSDLNTKQQSKIPAGSSVVFYRDSKLVKAELDSNAAVNFIVSSELEESLPGALVQEPHSSHSLPEEKTESKEDVASALWPRSSLGLGLKESAARGPDPEHLKALWSSTSHTSELQPVNSLEGIADDLTSVPFTMQDVKSEDGETPPPTMSASRMSLHDVTRAFQQVPSSSSGTPLRPTISPPTTNAPVARPPPNYTYGIPVAPPPPNNQNMRSAYPPYPSPMMSHSPAPVVYPHQMANSPVPSRMQVNGHNSMAGMYPGQAMWVPMPGGNAPGPQPQMMRPAYPQMMSYSPNSQPMYLPAVPTMQQQPNNNGNRGRVMMSPGLVHASPSLYGSPVMMPAGRAQLRADPNQVHASPPQNHHAPHPYTPTNSFMRPTGW